MSPRRRCSRVPYWSSCPPSRTSRGRGLRSRAGWRDGFLDGVTGESRAHTHALTRSCAHTHCLATWGRLEPPTALPLRGQDSRGRPPPPPTFTHTCTNLQWAGSHSGGGGPVLGVSTQGHPQSRIPGSIWGGRRARSSCKAGQGKRTAAGEAGRTDGGVDRAACARQVNK